MLYSIIKYRILTKSDIQHRDSENYEIVTLYT